MLYLYLKFHGFVSSVIYEILCIFTYCSVNSILLLIFLKWSYVWTLEKESCLTLGFCFLVLVYLGSTCVWTSAKLFLLEVSVRLIWILEYQNNTQLIFKCREADESRLREVCESFLGPPTGMAEAASSDSNKTAWDPCVLVRAFHSSFFLYISCGSTLTISSNICCWLFKWAGPFHFLPTSQSITTERKRVIFLLASKYLTSLKCRVQHLVFRLPMNLELAHHWLILRTTIVFPISPM